MNVLAISFIPPPGTSTAVNGSQRRLGVFLRALASLGARITLLHVASQEHGGAADDLDGLSESQSAFWGVPVRIALAPRRPRVATRWAHYGAGILASSRQPELFPYGGEAATAIVAHHLDAGPDLVFAQRLNVMLPVLQAGRRPSRLVLDIDDIEHVRHIRTVLSRPFYLGKAAELLRFPSLMAFERRTIAAAHLAFVCSDKDRAYLRRLGWGARVAVAPNAVALPASPPGVVPERTILYLGNMAWHPNRAAAERLVRRIWPMVRSRVPEARLLIAGPGSDTLPTAGSLMAGVEHLGFVDDLATLYARSRIVCCPLSVGTGTRVKLVEAASFARPIVSTRIGAEGLDYRDGEHILLRDDDPGLAEACVALLRDDDPCLRLGEAARAAMAARYDMRQVEARIAGMIQGVMSQGRG